MRLGQVDAEPVPSPPNAYRYGLVGLGSRRPVRRPTAERHEVERRQPHPDGQARGPVTDARHDRAQEPGAAGEVAAVAARPVVAA